MMMFFDIAKAAKNEKLSLPIILMQAGQGLKIIERHARATGYLLADNPVEPLCAIIGAKVSD